MVTSSTVSLSFFSQVHLRQTLRDKGTPYFHTAPLKHISSPPRKTSTALPSRAVGQPRASPRVGSGAGARCTVPASDPPWLLMGSKPGYEVILQWTRTYSCDQKSSFKEELSFLSEHHTQTLLLRTNSYNFEEKGTFFFPGSCEEQLSEMTFPKCLPAINYKTRDLSNIFLMQSEEQPTSHRKGGGFSQTNFISLSLVIH